MSLDMVNSYPLRATMAGALTSGVIDEVRNRLNGILANTEALFLDVEETPELIPYREHIRRQIAGLSALMEDLEDLQRPIGAEKLSGFSVRTILTEAIACWRRLIPEEKRTIYLSYSSHAHLMKIRADSGRLESAFVKLLNNAHEQTPAGERVSLSIEAGRERWVRICVSHPGAALSGEKLSHAFEPYFIMGRKSTGLGMSVARHTIEEHGGSISIFNNEMYTGLTIEVDLPLVWVHAGGDQR